MRNPHILPQDCWIWGEGLLARKYQRMKKGRHFWELGKRSVFRSKTDGRLLHGLVWHCSPKLLGLLDIFFIYIYIFFKFLAVLGLCCCTGFSSRWFLLLRSTGLGARGLQQLWPPSLAAPWHMGFSQIRDQTHVSCIGRWILYHWATRQALFYVFFEESPKALLPFVEWMYCLEKNWATDCYYPEMMKQFLWVW